MSKRILAVFLPRFLVEFFAAKYSDFCEQPSVVIIVDSLCTSQPQEVLTNSGFHFGAQSKVVTVNDRAHKLGARVGQSWVQARARARCLVGYPMSRAQWALGLSDLSEKLIGFGAPVSFQLPDILWVDVSGSQSVLGDEPDLAVKVSDHLKNLGHVCSVAVTSGALFSSATARYLSNPGFPVCISEVQAPEFAAHLPVCSLPISSKNCAWLEKLGLENVGQVRDIPERSLVSRLEAFSLQAERSGNGSRQAPEQEGLRLVSTILDFIWGRDATEIRPHQPLTKLESKVHWDEPVEAIGTVLVSLKGLCSQLVVGAKARGKSILCAKLSVFFEPRGLWGSSGGSSSGARTSQSEAVSAENQSRELQLEFKLACAVAHSDELERIIASRLLRVVLPGPAVSMTLEAKSLLTVRREQLAVSRLVGGQSAEEQLRSVSLLLDELQADIGSHSVGLLSLENCTVWEHASRFKCSDTLGSGSFNRMTSNVRSNNERSGDPEISGVCGEFEKAFQAYECIMTGRDAMPSKMWDPRWAVIGRGLPRKGMRLELFSQAFVIREFTVFRREHNPEWWLHREVYREYFRAWIESFEDRFAKCEGERTSNRFGAEVLLCFDRLRRQLSVCAVFD